MIRKKLLSLRPQNFTLVTKAKIIEEGLYFIDFPAVDSANVL